MGAHCQIRALESGGCGRTTMNTLRGMMWANNFWLLSDNREKLICVVNDIIEELFRPGHGVQAGIAVVDHHA